MDAPVPEPEGELLGGIEPVALGAGAYVMGHEPVGTEGPVYPDETPHAVTLTRDFAIARTEVTVDQFVAYLGYDPTADSPVPSCADCPVHTVSWDEAARFANAMSAAHALEACYVCDGDDIDVTCTLAESPYTCTGFRLPTEAEWEYAARAGEPLRYPGSDEVADVGWYQDNSGMNVAPVAMLAPNAWGLYDMGGNIRELVNDWHVNHTAAPAVDPYVEPDAGAHPVEKGGSFACIPEHLEPNTRYMHMNAGPEPTDFVRDVHVGFRVARSLE